MIPVEDFGQNYENAFNCKECPRTGDETGCPMWREIIMTNFETKQDKIVKGCGFAVDPHCFYVEMMRRATGTQAAAESLRNSFVESIARGAKLIADASKNPEQVPQIEKHRVAGNGQIEHSE